ncbi:hypothetical protein FH972_024345 [Carpinus fangiana]|uniref:Aspartyl aminopeptidase n=1 Tax=Carpinus fangiana TaxID=176857 RepID=A0A5N6KYP0_9ROSI|nr:hypothetical protein FH972_024345 [Carpinus fangiana]
MMTRSINKMYPNFPSTASPSTFPPPQVTSLPARPRTLKKPIDYAQPFCDFLSSNPTVFHAVSAISKSLLSAGFTQLSERSAWRLHQGGKYFVIRNGSSLIAFTVGTKYDVNNGVAIVAGHVDALTARLKPISKVDGNAGYTQLGVAPYAGGLNDTWWDRDLGIAGRVLVKDDKGKVASKLVDLHEPIARIPTLAPHFGAISSGPFNQETQMVPIVGLESDEGSFAELPADTFAASQPPRLVKAIAGKLAISDYSKIVNWELELYDVTPATLGGLDKEFIYGGRIDDKLCSWSAIEGLLASDPSTSPSSIKCVGLFDDEEIGSLLRQGARGNFLPSTIERIVDTFSNKGGPAGANLLAQTYANSFLISADVTHAVNPNFLGAYLHNHAPRLNVGLTVSSSGSGHLTTDAVSTAFLQRIAEKTGAKLQFFQVRNDTREGGTVGPMLSSAMGVRAVDAGLAQLSMHSIRATCGSLDPGLGVEIFAGFFDHFEAVDAEFRET